MACRCYDCGLLCVRLRLGLCVGFLLSLPLGVFLGPARGCGLLFSLPLGVRLGPGLCVRLRLISLCLRRCGICGLSQCRRLVGL